MKFKITLSTEERDGSFQERAVWDFDPEITGGFSYVMFRAFMAEITRYAFVEIVRRARKTLGSFHPEVLA